MAAPTGVTIVNHNGGGSTTYKYQVVAIDGDLHGTSPASSVATTTTGAATLSKFQYNYIKATIDPTAIAILIYGDKGLGGALTCLGVSRAVDPLNSMAAWEDMGFYSAGQEPVSLLGAGESAIERRQQNAYHHYYRGFRHYADAGRCGLEHGDQRPLSLR